MAEWTELLGDRQTTHWLITVVTKADLWWDRHREVIDYYTSGPYHMALGSAQSLNPKVLHHSSVFHKFYGRVPMSGMFDQNDREIARKHFAEVLLSALLSPRG